MLRMFGAKNEEVREGQRKIHNKQCLNVRSTPNINGMTKSRRMKLVGNV
jgi:hypothetical protein